MLKMQKIWTKSEKLRKKPKNVQKIAKIGDCYATPVQETLAKANAERAAAKAKADAEAAAAKATALAAQKNASFRRS